jgi:hypothetical protein
MKTKFYLRALITSFILMFIAANSFGFTVYLVDSYSNALSSGNLEYKVPSGTWLTATETATGQWDLTNATNGYSYVALRMTWNHQELKVTNVPTNTDYTYQTSLVTIKLLASGGVNLYNGGVVDYTSDGFWPIGITGDDGPGIVTFEMLPTVYTFRMIYKGQRCLIHAHNVATDGTDITFQMIKVCVQLNKADNTRGLDGGCIYFNQIGVWEYFGTTGYCNTYNPEDGDPLPACPDGENGRVRKQLLPGNYSIKMVYNNDEEVKAAIDCNSANTTICFCVTDLKKAEPQENFAMNLASYPNPFNSNTTVLFNLDDTQNVIISVYDMNGKMVKEISNGQMNEGIHKVYVNTEDLTSGYYILRVNTATNVSHMNIVKM